jgi:hypothetical protein
MAAALFAAYLSIQRCLQSIVPDKRATRQLALQGVSNFAQSSPKWKRAIRHPWLEQQPDDAARPGRAVDRFAGGWELARPCAVLSR